MFIKFNDAIVIKESMTQLASFSDTELDVPDGLSTPSDVDIKAGPLSLTTQR